MESQDIFTIPGRHYDSNIYLITGKMPALIDAGTGRNTKDILKEIEEHLPLEKITRIILTHEHFDHMGGAVQLKDATGGNAKIFATPITSTTVKEKPSPFAHMLNLRFSNFQTDGTLAHNQQVELGDETYSVLHTPGHSPGGLCLYQPQRGILFTGDTIFSIKEYPLGNYGRTDLPGSSTKELIRSIELLSTLNHVHQLYPGHGIATTDHAKEDIKRAYAHIRLYG